MSHPDLRTKFSEDFAKMKEQALGDSERTVKERYSAEDDWLDICTLDGNAWILTKGGMVYNCLSLGDARALAGVIAGEWAKGNYSIEDAPGIKRRNVDQYGTPDMSLLYIYRTRAKMTQEELSRAAGVTVSQIQRIEYGKIKSANITAKTLIALAGALGVYPIELVDIKQI